MALKPCKCCFSEYMFLLLPLNRGTNLENSHSCLYKVSNSKIIHVKYRVEFRILNTISEKSLHLLF